MSEEWFERLKVAIARDGRSLRQISLASGRGVNYIQQAMRDGKEVSASNLVRILDVLGSASALYVLTGLDLTREDEAVFRAVVDLPPEIRQSALKFLQDLQGLTDK